LLVSLLTGFDPRLGHMGFMLDNVALGRVFSEVFRFSCQFSLHRILHTHLSSGAGIIGQLVAEVPLCGASLDASTPTRISVTEPEFNRTCYSLSLHISALYFRHSCIACWCLLLSQVSLPAPVIHNYDLFNDAVNSWGYIASNRRVIVDNEFGMMWKECLWRNMRQFPEFAWRNWGKWRGNLSQDGRTQGPD
jgi:hypothetical protein